MLRGQRDAMTRLLEAKLWVESTAYAARLLADDQVPWLDVAGVVGWQRKAQGLLRSDVVTLPVAPVCAAWLAAHPALAKAMAAKSRVGFALKTLLADAANRALALARDELLDRAERVMDPTLRESFLANVPEHARILALSNSWLDRGRQSL